MKEARDKIQKYVVNNELEIEKVMKEYNNYIYTIIYNSHITFHKEDIEEIIVDTYLTLWNNRQKLDINKSMSPYISGITKRLILKKCRNKRQIENIEDYSEKLISVQNIELDYLESQQNELITNELNKMKEEDREIFVEYYYEQRKIKEIAIILDLSESKVKSKLFRIRKRLYKILKKGGYGNNE